MGQATRIGVLLDRPLADIVPAHHRDAARKAAFYQTSDEAISVWWQSYPLETNLVVGWAGGPAAIALSGKMKRFSAIATNSFGRAFGLSRATVARHVVATFHHDWSNDPYSRGAYSYSLVGGGNSNEALSRPVRGTLFFAGEATDREGRTATVHGAIASGSRAAEQVLRSL
jgi:monoamine oxidase